MNPSRILTTTGKYFFCPCHSAISRHKMSKIHHSIAFFSCHLHCPNPVLVCFHYTNAELELYIHNYTHTCELKHNVQWLPTAAVSETLLHFHCQPHSQMDTSERKKKQEKPNKQSDVYNGVGV